MEFQCKECGSRNSYDETAYPAGSAIEIPCRRCGTFNSITIPGEVQIASESTEIAPVSASSVSVEPELKQNYAVEKTESTNPCAK